MSKITISRLFHAALSLPKTIYFNFITFGIKGYKLPVYISHNTHIASIHFNTIKIEGEIKPFMILIGFGGSVGVVPNSRSEICLEKNSLLVFKGKAQFAAGCGIRNSGTIVLGKNFGMNRNSFLSCYRSVVIGDNFKAGWNCAVRDSDGHSIIKGGEKQKLYSPVHIGNNVWLCSFSHILKGVTLSDHTVVAYRSLVTKPFYEGHVLLGGQPAKIIDNDIDWEY